MVSTKQQFETSPADPVLGLENIAAGRQPAEYTAVEEFNAKFDHENSETLIGLLFLDDKFSNQVSAVMAIFNCSSLCAKYALMRARVLKHKQEMECVQLARRHELDLENAKCSNLHKQTTKKRLVLTENTLRVMQAHGYIFDGLLGPATGGQAILYRVFNLETYQVCCGKVYLKSKEDERAMESEIMTNGMIHRTGKKPNIAAFDAVLEFKHTQHPVNSIALIMPLYSISLQEILDAHGSEVDINFFKNIAKGLLTAGQCFEECGLSHSDIKPSNIMLDHGSPVVIDFGSVVRLGSAVEEYTRFYALDADSYPAGSDFDLNCIVVTLAKCFIPQFNVEYRTRQKLIEELEKCRGNLVSYANICIEALQYHSSSAALHGLELLLQPLPKSALA